MLPVVEPVMVKPDWAEAGVFTTASLSLPTSSLYRSRQCGDWHAGSGCWDSRDSSISVVQDT